MEKDRQFKESYLKEIIPKITNDLFEIIFWIAIESLQSEESIIEGVP